MDSIVKLANQSVGPGSNSTSRNQKILLISASIGIAVVAFLARYFRRRTHYSSRSRTKFDSYAYRCDANGSIASSRFPKAGNARSDVCTAMSVASSSRTRYTDSTLVTNPLFEGNELQLQLTCTQLGLLGIEALEKCINYWEDSVAVLRSSADCLPEHDQTSYKTLAQLEKILETANSLHKLTEQVFLDEDSALYEGSDRGYWLKSSSSIESFQSAEGFLSDDEDIQLSLQAAGYFNESDIPLYEQARRLAEAKVIPYRSLKTDFLDCKSGDQEYLSKLHCLRSAFTKILQDTERRHWISENGKAVLKEILVRADKDPTDFELCFDNFVVWSQEPNNWALIETELKDRGLRALTFYDIVLDFMFLDAFEDLEAPPASVVAVTQNRWLSNSFKETAIATAIWSVLKTKRRWLRFNDGFIAHFYNISEFLMPTLAWGFLGPPTELQNLCFFFKDKFLEFLRAIFSFDKVRYTTLDELAADVLARMEEMHGAVMERLKSQPEAE